MCWYAPQLISYCVVYMTFCGAHASPDSWSLLPVAKLRAEAAEQKAKGLKEMRLGKCFWSFVLSLRVSECGDRIRVWHRFCFVSFLMASAWTHCCCECRGQLRRLRRLQSWKRSCSAGSRFPMYMTCCSVHVAIWPGLFTGTCMVCHPVCFVVLHDVSPRSACIDILPYCSGLVVLNRCRSKIVRCILAFEVGSLVGSARVPVCPCAGWSGLCKLQKWDHGWHEPQRRVFC